jgi:hypothetical protein
MRITHVDEFLQLLEQSEGGVFSFCARGVAVMLRFLLGRPKPQSISDKLQLAQLEDRQKQQDDAVLMSQLAALFDSGRHPANLTDVKIAALLDVRLEVAQQLLEKMVDQDKLEKVVIGEHSCYHRTVPASQLRKRG